MLPQILTLVGTLVGATLGLSASLLSSFFGRRDNDLSLQRGIASEIMALFEDGSSPTQLLTPEESMSRRRLYLLGLRLESENARKACMKVVARSGESPYDENELLDAWNLMMNQVGAVYRRSRKDV